MVAEQEFEQEQQRLRAARQATHQQQSAAPNADNQQPPAAPSPCDLFVRGCDGLPTQNLAASSLSQPPEPRSYASCAVPFAGPPPGGEPLLLQVAGEVGAGARSKRPVPSCCGSEAGSSAGARSRRRTQLHEFVVPAEGRTLALADLPRSWSGSRKHAFKQALDRRNRMAAGEYVDRCRREEMLQHLFGDMWDVVQGECDYVTDDDCVVMGGDGEPLWDGHPLVQPLIRARQQAFVECVCRYSISELVRMAIEGHVGSRLLDQRTRRLEGGGGASSGDAAWSVAGVDEDGSSDSDNGSLGDVPSLSDGAGDGVSDEGDVVDDFA